MRQIRQYTKELKLSILNELETKRLCEVSRENNISASTIRGWVTDYDQNPKEAFKGHGNVWKEDSKIAKYERLLGQSYAEIAFLKKAYEALKQNLADERRKERKSTK